MKARAVSRMAGGTRRLDANQEAVRVAIGADFDHALNVARCGAFVPQFAAAARPEPGFAAFEGQAQRFGVHVRQHQDFIRISILHDGGDEAVGSKVELEEIPVFRFHV